MKDEQPELTLEDYLGGDDVDYDATFQIVKRWRDGNEVMYTYDDDIEMITYDQAIENLVEFEKDSPSNDHHFWSLVVKVQLIEEDKT